MLEGKKARSETISKTRQNYIFDWLILLPFTICRLNCNPHKSKKESNKMVV